MRYDPLPLRRRLGQAPPLTRFVVIDTHGRPVKGADVRVAGQTVMPGENTTDGNGITSISLAPGNYDVDVVFGPQAYHFPAKAKVPAVGDVWITVPICTAQPFATTPEILTLLAGVAVTTAGYYWKIEPVKVTGEVLIGASVFTAIYRLSCL